MQYIYGMVYQQAVLAARSQHAAPDWGHGACDGALVHVMLCKVSIFGAPALLPAPLLRPPAALTLPRFSDTRSSRTVSMPYFRT